MKKLLTFLMFFLLATIAAQAEEKMVTLDFQEITGFDKWGSSYSKHTVEYAGIGTVTFASANKQTSTITDKPVTKGGDVSFVANNGITIKSLTFTCHQWSSKTQTITLHTSIDYGVNYTKTSTTSSDFVLKASSLTSVNAVKFTFSSSSNQVGITSLEITYEEGSTPPVVTIPAPTFNVAAGTYTEDQLVFIDNYDDNYLYAYTLDGSDPAFDAELNVTNGTIYDNNEGIEITSSCTLKAIAVDGDGNTSSVTSAAYVINKPQVFASLEELVAADLTSGTTVTVSFENVPIKSFYKSGNYTNGIFFDIQKDGKDIEIYYKDVPETWVTGGTLSGTMTCPWKLYNGTWQLAPAQGSWAWTNLTYTAPVEKTITSLTVSGTPTKTEYYVGDAFDPAGLTVTATYSDETTAPITEGFEWEIDYGTGNEALVAGATSVDVRAYTDDVMSDVYTVNGLTVTVPVTLTSIAVSGTPTKTEYYVGDAFDPAGLVVTGTYSDSHQETITEGIEWTVDPETLALGTTSVDVTAGVGSVVSEVFTVNGLTVTENPYKKATLGFFNATSGDINSDIYYKAFQGKATTAPAINNQNLRLYQNGGYVTITGVKGVKISSVKITTSDEYASTTVGYCVDDEDAPTTGKSVAKSSDYTISDLNNQSVSIYCLGTDKKTRLEISQIEVTYTKENIALEKIELSGEYQTEFIQNSSFNHDGVVVTATYSDNDTQDVTAKADFTEPDMTSAGSKTVTVSYTEGEVTKTATYDITVAAETLKSIALSGNYKTTFKQNDEFTHEGLVVTATYNSGREEDVTEGYEVSNPDMTTVGNKTVTVSYNEKEATYEIKVLSAATIFYESFDTNDGTGGNDGQWSGSIASNNLQSDNEGWTFESEKGANKCAKFGASSSLGTATTPALGQTCNATMTFNAAAWDGSNESTTLKLSVIGGGSISPATVTMTKGEWNTFTATLTGLTAESKIKFEGNKTSDSRFFLDEVLIVSEPYHLKHNWGNGNETWQELTQKNGKWIIENAPYGGGSCTWKLGEYGEEHYVENPILVGNPVVGEECTFSLDPAAGTVTITKKGVEISTVIFFKQTTNAAKAAALKEETEPTWKKMRANGDGNTYYLNDYYTGDNFYYSTTGTDEGIEITTVKKDEGVNKGDYCTFNFNKDTKELSIVKFRDGSYYLYTNWNGNDASWRPLQRKNEDGTYSLTANYAGGDVYWSTTDKVDPTNQPTVNKENGADAASINNVFECTFTFNPESQTLTITKNNIVTDIKDVEVAGSAVKAYKVIENGQVIIVRGDQRFNIMGQPVR